MKPDMGTFPSRYKLPVAYNTEIGRIITRWAHLEWLLREVTYIALQIDPKIGRIVVREPQMEDTISMIEDIMSLNGATTTVNFAALRKHLIPVRNARDRLAHGVWMKHGTSKTPVLRVVKGSYPASPGSKSVKARLHPQAVEVTVKNLKDIVKGIDIATNAVNTMGREIVSQCASSPHKSP